MGYYKITNITNTLSKRHSLYNSIVDIVYVNNLMKKVYKLNPGSDMYYSGGSLPLSVHKLRLDGYIIVNEVSESMFKTGAKERQEEEKMNTTGKTQNNKKSLTTKNRETIKPNKKSGGRRQTKKQETKPENKVETKVEEQETQGDKEN